MSYESSCAHFVVILRRCARLCLQSAYIKGVLDLPYHNAIPSKNTLYLSQESFYIPIVAKSMQAVQYDLQGEQRCGHMQEEVVANHPGHQSSGGLGPT